MKKVRLLVALLFSTLLVAETSGVEVGQKIWELEGRTTSPIALSHDETKGYVANASGEYLTIFDTETGELIESIESPRGRITAGPILSKNGLLYLSCEHGSFWYNTSTSVVTSSVYGGGWFAYGYFSYAVDDNEIFYIGRRIMKTFYKDALAGVGSTQNIDRRFCIDDGGIAYMGSNMSHTGKSYTIKAITSSGYREILTKGGEITSPTLGDDDTIYSGTKSNGLVALDTDTLNLKWSNSSYNPSEQIAIGENKSLFFNSGEKTICINGNDGSLIWESSISTKGTPVIGKDTKLYCPTVSGLYVLDSSTGQEIEYYEISVGDYITLTQNGVIITANSNILSANSKIIAIKTSAGPLDSPWPMFNQNSQRTGFRPSSGLAAKEEAVKETATTEGWGYLKQLPWIYSKKDSVWYYMKAVGDRNFLYNYTTKKWGLMDDVTF
jgi:hypothetical protein